MGNFLSDILAFEKNKLGNMAKKYKKNPERLLLGINTPFESKMWGGLTGKKYEPTVDMFGGSTKDDVATAKAKGINTGPGEGMHNIARAITSIYAGKYGLDSIQGAGSAGGQATAGASGGGGATTAGGSSGGLSSAGRSWMDYARMGSNMMGGGGGGQRPAPAEVPGTDMSIIDKTASGGYLQDMLERYNSNQGPYNDGHRIQLAGDQAYLMDDRNNVVGQASADDRLYAALEDYERQIREA